MLSRMVPSSPPEKRTFHLLKTPDILCANDVYPDVIFPLLTGGSLSTRNPDAVTKLKETLAHLHPNFRSLWIYLRTGPVDRDVLPGSFGWDHQKFSICHTFLGPPASAI